MSVEELRSERAGRTSTPPAQKHAPKATKIPASRPCYRQIPNMELPCARYRRKSGPNPNQLRQAISITALQTDSPPVCKGCVLLPGHSDWLHEARTVTIFGPVARNRRTWPAAMNIHAETGSGRFLRRMHTPALRPWQQALVRLGANLDNEVRSQCFPTKNCCLFSGSDERFSRRLASCIYVLV